MTKVSGITEELLVPVIIREIIDAIAYNNDYSTTHVVWNYFAIILSVHLLCMFVRYSAFTLWSLSEQRVVRNILHYYYLIQEPLFYDSLEPTEPVTRCSNSERFFDILNISADAFEALAMCILYIAIIASYNVPIMLIAVAPIPVDMLVRYMYGKILVKQIAKMQTLGIAMDNHTVNLIQSIDLVRNCATAEYEQNRYDECYNKNIYNIKKKLSRYELIGNAIVHTCFSLGNVLVLIHIIDLDITVGTIVMLYEYYSSLKYKFINLSSAYAEYTQWKADTKTALGLYKKAIVLDRPKDDDLVIKHKAIQVSRPFCIEQLKVTIPAMEILHGKHYVIVGPIGSGKSTFFALLMKRRTQSPPDNTVFISGIDVNDIRSTDSYIHCTTGRYRWLHDRTVRENVTYGIVDYNTELVDKYMTTLDLTEESIKLNNKLSDGQIQKCILIRAALSNKNIILLDEPTSAMSPEHEVEFFKVWKDVLFKNKTLIIITHAQLTSDFEHVYNF